MAQVNLRKACERLAAVVKTLAGLHCDELKDLRESARRHLDEPDFVWLALLRSSSTLGNSRGYKGLFDPPYRYKRIAFKVLSRLSPKDRHRNLLETLTASKVSYSKKKAAQLAQNFNKIVNMGASPRLREASTTRRPVKT